MLDYISINSHSSIRFEKDLVIYADPFHIARADHDADIIFLTHDHYDHYSPEDVEKVKKDTTLFVAPQSTAALLKKNGVDSGHIHVAAPGDTFDVAGVAVEAVKSYNPHKNFHPEREGWLGYIITLDGVRHYVAGDMDVTEEGKAVRCDVALIPVGGKYTMDVDEGVELISSIRPRYAIPTHYGDIVGKATDGSAFAEKIKAKGLPTEVVLKI
ncbi:MAG: MBL fold metallo-hydrolase [Clostridiales bacterium]|nr:MBL fold metallo-hydrolase [Clostridiales bacterium]